MADRRSKFKPTAGWKMQLSRYRSVGLYPARARCGKAWLIQAKHLGIETSMGLSDEAMRALFKLYIRANASPKKVAVEWRGAEVPPSPLPKD